MLPNDIQGLIWKKYYVYHVMAEIKGKTERFLVDSSNMRRENDVIMRRFDTEWS